MSNYSIADMAIAVEFYGKRRDAYKKRIDQLNGNPDKLDELTETIEKWNVAYISARKWEVALLAALEAATETLPIPHDDDEPKIANPYNSVDPIAGFSNTE